MESGRRRKMWTIKIFYKRKIFVYVQKWRYFKCKFKNVPEIHTVHNKGCNFQWARPVTMLPPKSSLAPFILAREADDDDVTLNILIGLTP